MKFRPILFSTLMVKAILDGSKSQTRRGLTKRNSYYDGDSWPKHIALTDMDWDDCFVDDGPSPAGNPGPYLKCAYPTEGTRHRIYPKVEVGDVLWVRETTKVGAWNDEEFKAAFDYRASHELPNTPWVYYDDIDRFHEHHLKWLDELDRKGIEPDVVDIENERFAYFWEPGQSPFDWKPSIFMPKEACRLFLKVKKIRIERLHDISPYDSVEEGIQIIKAHNDESRVLGYHDYTVNPKYGFNTFFDPVESFHSLWESINGKQSLESNPWVLVYEFEKIERPKEFLS